MDHACCPCVLASIGIKQHRPKDPRSDHRGDERQSLELNVQRGPGTPRVHSESLNALAIPVDRKCSVAAEEAHFAPEHLRELFSMPLSESCRSTGARSPNIGWRLSYHDHTHPAGRRAGGESRTFETNTIGRSALFLGVLCLHTSHRSAHIPLAPIPLAHISLAHILLAHIPLAHILPVCTRR